MTKKAHSRHDPAPQIGRDCALACKRSASRFSSVLNLCCQVNGPRIGRFRRIPTDQIRANPSPSNPWSIEPISNSQQHTFRTPLPIHKPDRGWNKKKSWTARAISAMPLSRAAVSFSDDFTNTAIATCPALSGKVMIPTSFVLPPIVPVL